VVKGVLIDFIDQDVEIANVNTDFDKVLKVDNKLFQNSVEMTSQLQNILAILQRPNREAFGSFRGDPSLELMDKVGLDDATDKIKTLGHIIRNQLIWDGTLTAQMAFLGQPYYLVYMSFDKDIIDDMGNPTTYSGDIAQTNAFYYSGGGSAHITNNCQVFITGDFTVGTGNYCFDIWFYPESTLGHPQALFKIGNFFWHITTGGYISYTGADLNVSSTTPLVLNKWQHLVWEKQDGILSAYVDDVLHWTRSTNDYVQGDWIKLGDGGHILGYVDELKFEIL
jgi:hypothetical protein